jgi:hypothetical protein
MIFVRRVSMSGAVVLAAVAAVAPVGAQDADLVRRAQQVPVSALDPAFPSIPFDRWLGEVSGLVPDRVQWEVNDCGEGGDGLQAPTCVEAVLDLGAATSAHASLIVADLEGAPGQPAIWMLYAMTGPSVTTFPTLADWASYVRRHRP